jgi:hypothetical protein
LRGELNEQKKFANQNINIFLKEIVAPVSENKLLQGGPRNISRLGFILHGFKIQLLNLKRKAKFGSDTNNQA